MQKTSPRSPTSIQPRPFTHSLWAVGKRLINFFGSYLVRHGLGLAEDRLDDEGERGFQIGGCPIGKWRLLDYDRQGGRTRSSGSSLYLNSTPGRASASPKP